MKWPPLISTLLVVVGLSSCTPTTPTVDTASDKAAIEELYQAWVETTKSRDLEAFASFLAPDARFQPPNHAELENRQEILEFYRALYDDRLFALTCRQQQVEVAASGDMAWSRGICDGTFTGQDGQAARMKTKWLKVWQKQPNGEWMCLQNMWNSDLPATL